MAEAGGSDSSGRGGGSVHAFVFCWPGREANAHRIAAAIAPHVEHLTVIYKNDTDLAEEGAGDWVRVPSDWFYGKQFRRSLELHRGDIMLQIQADAGHRDWPLVVSRCRTAFRMPKAGVWSPDVYHSAYTPHLTRICEVGDGPLIAVTAVDGVTWALSSAVIARLKALDYEQNNLGWLITETASAFAFTNDMLVLMDIGLKVEHPKGSGYDRRKALAETERFMRQLSPPEVVHLRWMHATRRLRERPPGRWKRRAMTLVAHARGSLRALGPAGRLARLPQGE